MPKEPAWYEFFQQQADMDPLAMVEQTFSRTKVGGSAVFAPIQDIGLLRLSLLSQDGLSQEEDKLLRKMLTHQLEVSKRFSQVWIQQQPDLREMMQAWQEQIEATDRWNVFMKLYAQLGDIQAAYRFAFEAYQPAPLEFQNTEEQKYWLALLANEQQRMVLLGQMFANQQLEPDCALKDGQLYYRGVFYHLTPTYYYLLECLWNELPQSFPSLLKAMGRSVASKDNMDTMVAWISELNSVLNRIWGKPGERKRWILRCRINDEAAYQLVLPKLSIEGSQLMKQDLSHFR